MNSRLLIAFGILCLFAGPDEALACSCMMSNLELRYEQSPNVFTALITSGEFAEDGNVSTEFQVTEIFKGSVTFNRITTTGRGTSCSMSIAVGHAYLFFMGDSGKIGFCSGHGIVGEQGSSRMNEYVAVLRAYKAGQVADPSVPWQFSQNDGTCWLSANFIATEERYASSVRFFYRFKSSALEEQILWDYVEEYVPGFEIFLLDWISATDAWLNLQTANHQIKARWAPANRQFVHKGTYRVIGDDALAFARDLSDTKAITVSGFVPSHGVVEAEIRTTNAGTAIDDFLACVDSRGQAVEAQASKPE